jgi:AcrR family transcriptional regulator
MRLLEVGRLADLSVNAVVAEAGVAKGTFYVHFPTRDDYMVALHEAFHTVLLDAIDAAAGGVRGGLERIKAGAVAYLDLCLKEKAMKALLLDARAEPAIRAQIRATSASFSKRFSGEFGAAGWPYPVAATRLFIAMVTETALYELEHGGASEDVRHSLWQFLEKGSTP